MNGKIIILSKAYTFHVDFMNNAMDWIVFSKFLCEVLINVMISGDGAFEREFNEIMKFTLLEK